MAEITDEKLAEVKSNLKQIEKEIGEIKNSLVASRRALREKVRRALRQLR